MMQTADSRLPVPGRDVLAGDRDSFSPVSEGLLLLNSELSLLDDKAKLFRLLSLSDIKPTVAREEKAEFAAVATKRITNLTNASLHRIVVHMVGCATTPRWAHRWLQEEPLLR